MGASQPDLAEVLGGSGVEVAAVELLKGLPGGGRSGARVGGRGPRAGVAGGLWARRRATRLATVEPEGSAALAAAIAAGPLVRLEHTASIADGLLPLSVGKRNFEILRSKAEPVLVSDAAIIEATRWLNRDKGLTVEPSGAATTAAVRSGALVPPGPTVLIVSGGNADPAMLAELGAAR